MSAIKSNDFDQLKKLANEGIDVSTVADFVFNEQKMNEPIMWKPDIVSAILPDPTASLSENTEPEEDKLSDQEIFHLKSVWVTLRQPKTIFIVDQYPIQNLPQIEFP
jgi:hypothetical protein